MARNNHNRPNFDGSNDQGRVEEIKQDILAAQAAEQAAAQNEQASTEQPHDSHDENVVAVEQSGAESEQVASDEATEVDSVSTTDEANDTLEYDEDALSLQIKALLPKLRELDEAITTYMQTPQVDGKKTTLTAARRKALVDIGIFNEESVAKISSTDLTHLFKATYQQRKENDLARRAKSAEHKKAEADQADENQTASNPDNTVTQAATGDAIQDVEHEKEKKLLERSREVKPYLDDIEAALQAAQDAIQNGNKTEIGVIRATLVRLNVFGDKSALEVGNISDDDIVALVQYARGSARRLSNTSATPPAIPATSTNRTPIPGPQLPQASNTTSVRAPIPAPVLPNTATRAPIPSPVIPASTPVTRTPIPGPNLPTNPNILNDKLDELDDARTEWAKITAKRHRRVIFGAFIKRSQAYKDAQENYTRLSREVAKLELKDALANEPDLTQKRAMVDLKWIEEQNRVRAEATRFVEDRLWWKAINRASEIMNSGGKFKRYATKITIGATAGALGALTFGAGTAGAAAALMAFRFGNSQVSKVAGGIGQLTDAQKAALQNERVRRSLNTDDQILDHRANAFESQYEKDSKKQRTRRMRAVGVSALTAAAGAGVGYAAHEAIQHIDTNWFGSSAQASSGPSPIQGLEGNGGGAGTGDLGLPSSGEVTDNFDSGLGDTAQNAAPEVPVITTGHDLLHSADTFYVRSGEGWYETFRDMGIPEDKWANVLQDAGPELRDLGAAYFDNTEGQWFISQPGNLSVESIQTIADSSAKFGYAFKPIA